MSPSISFSTRKLISEISEKCNNYDDKDINFSTSFGSFKRNTFEPPRPATGFITR